MNFDGLTRELQPGVIGRARVEHYTVSDEDAKFHNLRCSFHPGGRKELLRPGCYVRLYVDGVLTMSDTDYERWTNRPAVEQARGDVLIGGLGIGLIIRPMLEKVSVHTVTIIERSDDVVQLVRPMLLKHRESSKLRIHTADVRTWTPLLRGRQFDFIYLDIWPSICTDDYAEHVMLRRRYQRWLRPGGKVMSWEFDWLRELRRMGR